MCLSYRFNTSKMGKFEEIQGQINQFQLSYFAHIRTCISNGPSYFQSLKQIG